MNYFQGLVDLLRSDGSIIINKNLAFEIGLENAIVYSELLSKYKYFLERDMLTEDGYFYNTVDNLRLDTTLPDKRQRKAINKLEKLNLIKTDLRGLPPKRHFKIINDANYLLSLLSKGNDKRAELDEKQVEKADISKKRYFDRFNSSDMTETNIPNRNVNNTNYNNAKNNTKIYIDLTANGSFETVAYNYLYRDYFKRNHPQIDKAKYNNLCLGLSEIISEYGEDFYKNMVKHHMEECIDNYDNQIASEKAKADYFVTMKDRYLKDGCLTF